MKPVETLIILIVTVCTAYGVGSVINYLENLRRKLNYARRVQKEFIGAYLDANILIAQTRLDRVHGIAKSCHKIERGVSLFELTSLIADSQEKIFAPAKDYTVPFLFDIFDAEKKKQDPEEVYLRVYDFIASRGEEALLKEVLAKYEEIVDYFFASGTSEQRAEELVKVAKYVASHDDCVAGTLFYTLAVKVRDAAHRI